MGKYKKDEGLARTASAVRAIASTNPNIPKNIIEDSIDVLCGNRKAVKLSDHSAIEKPFTRKEVATLLGKSVQTVDLYARMGKLKRITRTGSRRSVGYTPESVRALVAGKEIIHEL